MAKRKPQKSEPQPVRKRGTVIGRLLKKLLFWGVCLAVLYQGYHIYRMK